ncbi:hypothetical protein WJX72_000947 [[Myrmecia] bisecta]|uniref:Uncharacterized protein n=1 Tax=[Myrmecia] bisecta TaxID=41462 RepID=A0AAW1Q6F5_9CHLO
MRSLQIGVKAPLRDGAWLFQQGPLPTYRQLPLRQFGRPSSALPAGGEDGITRVDQGRLQATKRRVQEAKLALNAVQEDPEELASWRAELKAADESYTLLLQLLLQQRLLEAAQSGQPSGYHPAAPPAGPPKRNLARLAVEELRPHPRDPKAWVLAFADGWEELFVDPDSAVEGIQSWVQLGVKPKFRLIQEGDPLHPHWLAPAALAINGFQKVGKSFTQFTVLPTVVAMDDMFGVGKEYEPVVLQLDGRFLNRVGDTTAMLQALLRQVLTWAVYNNVPVAALPWNKAVDLADAAPQFLDRSRVANMILKLLEGIQCPVLGLFDELQSFLLPLLPDGRPDLEGARFLRNEFLKQLILYGPRRATSFGR